ncbi:bifunctional proline dehydrogenase/L-glutamate gamma-semialdehyde dehydrogenase [Microbacterium sp. NC79]|uniref:bifunctional proline dehydrogenase/L-glutamate gamma-semialdehyde dehydrogenase n=1 Tax=Microbacterium sp. NC79 TaxID=2851009 RepID=UPI001C2B9E5B|nr:bifunctional proline dehydrogenase/L-glutamate gamma-semialdehyde dehydrogenase [Microbacterium sp. NC79]MBV0893906.1 bifunctional proline dehydrogenase/L-glutamate gamma-semialdehyde dehydrogenase [Microbacterium sp. NC79]
MTAVANPRHSGAAGLTTDERNALADDAIALVQRWLQTAASIPPDVSGQRLAGVLKDPHGLDFTVGFVDGVVRPEDLHVAARNLRRLAPQVPSFLPWPLRAAVRLGGVTAPILPSVVVPIARTVLRKMVGHLIVDATDAKLGAAIAHIKKPGIRLNMNLLGEAVLGSKEAGRRLAGTIALVERADVDYVSIKVSSTVSPHSPWAFDEDVEHVVQSLTPLFQRAAAATPAKFINLDMEEYKDLDLTIAVFTKLLDKPEFTNLEAGIVLQAYLPDALSAMIRLQEWAAVRRANGGAGIKVRVVKGANLPMEHVDASLHGWPVATWHTKQDSDTNYKRVLEYALDAERIRNIKIGVAGHNLFDIAFAWLLAKQRGVSNGIDIEMLLGMAQSQAEAVKRDVGELLLYTPVVHPQEFDVAIAYLIRRLEEGASSDNFMSAVFELSESADLFEREKNRFLASLAALDTAVPAPHRVQDRTQQAAAAPTDHFENTPDTDPAVDANRGWGRAILSNVSTSTLGTATVDASIISTEDELDAVIDRTTAAGTAWGAMSGAERAAILHRAGDALQARRAELMEISAAEAGKTLDQSDPEVSEAIDFAHYYAELAKELDDVDGAVFTPAKLTVVVPPWNFPIAIPAGSTLAALAAGSPVIIKPSRQARRSGAVMVEALWEAGVPRDVLSFVQLADNALGERLMSHPAVERVILTGGYETAELFRSFRKDLPLLAETSGKNAMIVTPSADLDLAVKDVVYSAFGHAGQKCSAASLVVLVGSVATSKRFRNQLLDAVSSLVVGYPDDATAQMGPIIEPARGKLKTALTTIEPGQQWLIEPRQLDDSGKLWSPGVREGVQRGSEYHRVEYFGPILGIMTAKTLDEAIAIVNDIDYGLTSGLHSLDTTEINQWLTHIEAGNLYVNRGTTGAIVQRQPFGGWKKSAVGAGTKAGGPNYLIGLGHWTPAEARIAPAEPITPLQDAFSGTPAEHAMLARACASDAHAWQHEFGVARDRSGLTAERNVFRYRPRLVHVRLSEGEPLVSLVRVLSAAKRVGATVTVSSAIAVPRHIAQAAGHILGEATVEDDVTFATRMGAAAPDHMGTRIRLIGGTTRLVAEATNGSPDVAIYAGAVTESGRIEMLPFVQEQAVSVTAHRFGTANHLTDTIL